MRNKKNAKRVMKRFIQINIHPMVVLEISFKRWMEKPFRYPIYEISNN